MTVNTSESTTTYQRSHQQAEKQGDAASSRSTSMLAAVVALPRTVKIAGAAAFMFGALLAIGVPLASLVGLIALGGCLSMHLFMGHGTTHGDHAGHEMHGRPAAPASQAEADSQR